MGTEVLMLAAAAALSYYNSDRTQKKQDAAAATQIQNQGRAQRAIDERVANQVASLEGSTAADERAQALQGYMDTLGKNRRVLNAGLSPEAGSIAFRGDSAAAAGDVQDYATKAAGLMARIDGAGMQRQGEGFGYGHLATDTGVLARNAAGQSYLDELRLRRIKRNPWLDAASGVLSGMAGAGMNTGAQTGGGGGSMNTDYLGQGQGWRTGYGAGQ